MPELLLRIIDGPGSGTEIEVPQSLEIGRASAGQGNLGGDPQLSRSHARIGRSDDGGLVVRDLGSTNGTFLNGERLTEPAPLGAGDRIAVGTSILEAAVSFRELQPTAVDHHGLIEYDEAVVRTSKGPGRLLLLGALALLLLVGIVLVASGVGR